MVVESEHRMDRMMAQRAGREIDRGKRGPGALVGILCPGNELREINHRSFAGTWSARDLNRKATGNSRQKAARPPMESLRPSLGWVPFILSNGKFAEP